MRKNCGTIAIYRTRSKEPRNGVVLSTWNVEAFHRRVDRSGGPHACWPFKGATGGFGHGRIKIAGRLLLPHRIAWVIANGDLVPDRSYHGGVVMHRCDNPICCNPKHLVLGTQAENAADMAKKGRGYSHINGAHNQKLTWEIVTEIRASRLSSREASAVFGVSDGHIRAIRRHRVWSRPVPLPASLNGRA